MYFLSFSQVKNKKYIKNNPIDYKIFFTFADLDRELNTQKQYEYK